MYLRAWWERISTIGPNFGYFPNASKTWLITKDGLRDAAATSFTNTGVNVITDGRPYLGTALGTQEYIGSQVESRVNEWTANLQCLANIHVAESTPRCILCPYTWIDEHI